MSDFKLRVDVKLSNRTLGEEQLKWVEEEWNNYEGNKSDFIRDLIEIAYQHQNQIKDEKEDILSKIKQLVNSTPQDKKETIPEETSQQAAQTMDSLLSQLDNM